MKGTVIQANLYMIKKILIWAVKFIAVAFFLFLFLLGLSAGISEVSHLLGLPVEIRYTMTVLTFGFAIVFLLYVFLWCITRGNKGVTWTSKSSGNGSRT